MWGPGARPGGGRGCLFVDAGPGPGPGQTQLPAFPATCPAPSPACGGRTAGSQDVAQNCRRLLPGTRGNVRLSLQPGVRTAAWSGGQGGALWLHLSLQPGLPLLSHLRPRACQALGRTQGPRMARSSFQGLDPSLFCSLLVMSCGPLGRQPPLAMPPSPDTTMTPLPWHTSHTVGPDPVCQRGHSSPHWSSPEPRVLH